MADPPARSEESMIEDELSDEATRNVAMWRRNFVIMALFFSVGEATVTTPLGYATALCGPTLGAIAGGLGMLWVVVSCLLVGPFAVKSLGAKQTMLVGTALDSVFACFFALATYFPMDSSPQWAIMLFSPLCCGLGVGMIWTAQGTFFTATVALVINWSRKAKPISANFLARRNTLPANTLPAALTEDAIDEVAPASPKRSLSHPVDSLIHFTPLRRRRTSTIGDPQEFGAKRKKQWLQTFSGMVFTDPVDLEIISEDEEEDHEDAQLQKATTTAMLGSMFAALFLAIDVLMKISVSLLQGSFFILEFHEPFVDVFPMFIGYAVVSVAMVFGIAIVKDPEEGEQPPNRPRADSVSDFSKPGFCARMAGAVRLWRHPELWCFGMTSFTFGFSSGYMNGYVNGTFTTSNSMLGAASIGALMAISSLVAAGLSLLFGPLASTVGKGPIVLLGAIAFAAIPLAVLAGQPCAENDYWGTGLMSLYVLQGVGRAVYESTNKALFADNFSGSQSAGAFANVMMMNGFSFFSSTVLQSSLPIVVLAIVIVVFAALTPVGYLFAPWLRARKTSRGRPFMGASLQPFQEGS